MAGQEYKSDAVKIILKGGSMRKLILGSTSHRGKMYDLCRKFLDEGHEVKTPAFDDHPDFDELQLCQHHIGLIRWCDEVHAFWDGRSTVFVFDMGAVMALGKPVRFEYIEPKTLDGVFTKYAAQSHLTE